ncbi:MAG: energy transducer TonB [Prevotella sp.]|nr:energy transducer TonB [Prevotella sp.]
MTKGKSICKVLVSLFIVLACYEPEMMAQTQTFTIPYRPDYVDEDRVYDVADQMPQFPGGFEKLKEFIEKNRRYPKSLQDRGIQGRVVVTFVVEKTGKISHAKVVRGVDPALDKEALRVVRKMPQWIPGRIYGKNVDVKYTMPVDFRLH